MSSVSRLISNLSKYLLQQKTMLWYWWRKPSNTYGDFDITPNNPPRMIFGSQVESRCGSFRPTLVDVVSGKARNVFYGKG